MGVARCGDWGEGCVFLVGEDVVVDEGGYGHFEADEDVLEACSLVCWGEAGDIGQEGEKDGEFEDNALPES